MYMMTLSWFFLLIFHVDLAEAENLEHKDYHQTHPTIFTADESSETILLRTAASIFAREQDYKNLLGVVESQLSAGCKNSIKQLIRNITDSEKMEKSAGVRMLDSWGKPPAGLLLGNFLWMGSYHECMAVPGAQYCLNKV